MYLSNYLYSGMIVLALYAEYAVSPSTFGPRYVQFLSGGFPGPPFRTVRRTLGVDLAGAGLLDKGLSLRELRLAEFRDAITAK